MRVKETKKKKRKPCIENDGDKIICKRGYPTMTMLIEIRVTNGNIYV